jgi:hypothetical protein
MRGSSERVKIKDSGQKPPVTNLTMGPFVGRWGLVRRKAPGLLSTYLQYILLSG